MLSILRYLFVAFVCAASGLILRYAYVASTEGTGPKKARAIFIATLAFASFWVVLPLWWVGYESQLPVFDFDGVIESVHVENSSSKYFSAELSILTSSGGTITIHVSNQSKGWIVGQHLRVRYYSDTGELIRASFFDANGNEEGVANRTSSMTRALSVVLGIFLIVGACFRYKRDPEAEIESEDDHTMGPVYDFDQQQLTEEVQKQIQADTGKVIARQKKWAKVATGSFIASCAAVWPFLAGNPLHRYWDTLGVFFLFVAMVLLIPFAIALGWGISLFFYTRGEKKIDR